MALPPGPWWPSVFQTVAFLRSGQDFIARAAERYGDLFTVRTLVFGTQVFTSDPEITRQVFTGDPEVFGNGAGGAARMITGETAVLVIDSTPHKRMRRLLMPPFHGERMAAYAEEMRSVTERVISGWKVGDRRPLLPAFQRIALEVIVANVFGLPEGPQRDHFATKMGKMMDRLASPAGAFFLVPALQRDLGPLWPWRRLKAQFDELEAMMFGEIADRRKKLADPSAPRADDILTLLIEARDEHGEGMGDQEIRDQLIVLLAGGHETTASSLAWACERILAHPEIHERLVGEIEDAAAQGRTAAADLARGAYLDATVKEVLRQRPSVPAVGRTLLKPVVVRGFEIPAGVMVSPSIFLTHRRPDLYPDPERFLPDRFLDKKIDPYAYLPFGGGPRRCIGAAFATQEMKIVLSTVLRRFQLRLADPPPLRPAPRSVFFAPEGGTRVDIVGERRPALSAAVA
jgi:cytochrome P450